MSRWKIALIVVAVLVVAVLGLHFLRGHGARPGAGRQGPAGSASTAAAAGGQGQGKQTPVPVTVVPVARQDVPVYLTALGTVHALNTVTVRPQVGGQLLKLTFTEGTEVKKGQVLAEIDPRTYQAQYDQAVARQRQDQAQLQTARSNLARSRDLIKKNFISKQDLDSLRNTVSQLEATVAADAAAARDSKVQLDYTKVVAPIDGLAGIRQVDPGNVVGTSDAIVTLTEVHPINVLFQLPEQNLEAVRTAQAESPLPVAALDRTDSHVIADGGVLKVIDNQIDVNSGTFNLKAEFDNTGNALWPGQFVNVRMRVRTVKNGLVVPSQAVQRGPDGDYVYLVQSDDTVKMQNVVVAGEADDAHTLLSSGVAAGDRVVTEGQFRLKPGSKVQALKPGEVPKAPTADEIKKATEQGGRGRHGGRH